jgi:ASC-1-like (ASCH) protein
MADGKVYDIDYQLLREIKIHQLKILPKYFEDVQAGKKNFEIRKNDRDFKVGDILILKECENGKYTGRIAKRKVNYILYDIDTIGLTKGYCILGLEDKAKSEEEEQMREKINRAVKAINQDMAAHSGTGEEVIQAYCGGLKKALGYLENIGELKGE